MTLEISQLRLRLNDFDLEVDAVFSAPVTVLFGASGAGKTSLLETIVGLRSPSNGKIALAGSEIVNTSKNVFVPSHRRRIGYLPQDGALFPHLSVDQNLRYGFDPCREVSAGLSFDHVVDVLEMGSWLHREISSLSGGEQKRVALGRALLAAPRLLLLDEPLASLDPALQSKVLPYLQRVRDEFAIPMIYVTHSPEEVIALGDEAVILERGKITRRGKPADLFLATDQMRYTLKP